MPRDDYEAISKIIEEVVGKDTITAVTLLQGIKYYFDNKTETIKIVKEDKEVTINKNTSIINHRESAAAAMKRYTERLRKENEKYRKKNKKKKDCSTSG